MGNVDVFRKAEFLALQDVFNVCGVKFNAYCKLTALLNTQAMPYCSLTLLLDITSFMANVYDRTKFVHILRQRKQKTKLVSGIFKT